MTGYRLYGHGLIPDRDRNSALRNIQTGSETTQPHILHVSAGLFSQRSRMLGLPLTHPYSVVLRTLVSSVY
jgi:hypothetical protein